MISQDLAAANSIRHVMFDADDVLQSVPGGWYAAMEPYLGERAHEFLHDTWKDELPTLAGDGDYLPMLADALQRYGVPTPVEEVFAAVWQHIEVDERSTRIVTRLRTAGYGVHLGTNQDRHRGEYMKRALGYQELFDVQCYSYELGAAKPDPAYFTKAADRIGAPTDSILFIDDNQRNVDGARTAGMWAERWQLTDGHAALLETLAAHGIELSATPNGVQP